MFCEKGALIFKKVKINKLTCLVVGSSPLQFRTEERQLLKLYDFGAIYLLNWRLASHKWGEHLRDVMPSIFTTEKE